MPAKSQAQQELMAIAEHHPEKVKGKNKGVLKMSHKQLHDFAATPRKGLAEHHQAVGSHHGGVHSHTKHHY